MDWFRSDVLGFSDAELREGDKMYMRLGAGPLKTKTEFNVRNL